MAQGGKVCIAANVNSILRTGLHAGVALPAHIGFNIVGTAISFIDVHDIGRAYIDAMSATVTTSHINKCWHDLALPLYIEIQRWID